MSKVIALQVEIDGAHDVQAGVEDRSFSGAVDIAVPKRPNLERSPMTP